MLSQPRENTLASGTLSSASSGNSVYGFPSSVSLSTPSGCPPLTGARMGWCVSITALSWASFPLGMVRNKSWRKPTSTWLFVPFQTRTLVTGWSFWYRRTASKCWKPKFSSFWLSVARRLSEGAPSSTEIRRRLLRLTEPIRQYPAVAVCLGDVVESVIAQSEQRIVLRVVAHDGRGQQGQIERAAVVLRVRQADRVGEMSVVHAQPFCFPVHQVDEARFAAGDMKRQRDGRIVAGLHDQPAQQFAHGHALPGLEQHARLAADVVYCGNGNGQVLLRQQRAVFERIKNQVSGHQLGQRSGLHARIGILVHQNLIAGVVVQQVGLGCQGRCCGHLRRQGESRGRQQQAGEQEDDIHGWMAFSGGNYSPSSMVRR